MSISKEQFKQLIGGYGFEQFDETALEQFGDTLAPMLAKSVDAVKSLKGGRVSMPGEYFAHPTNFYTTNASGTNESMAHATQDYIRPSLPETFPTQAGGNAKDSLDSVFEKALKEYRQTGGKGLKLKKEQKQEAKTIFKGIVEWIFKEVRKVATKTKTLKGTQMKRAVKKIK
jgi:hypothetical protein